MARKFDEILLPDHAKLLFSQDRDFNDSWDASIWGGYNNYFAGRSHIDMGA